MPPGLPGWRPSSVTLLSIPPAAGALSTRNFFGGPLGEIFAFVFVFVILPADLAAWGFLSPRGHITFPRPGSATGFFLRTLCLDPVGVLGPRLG